MSADSGWLRRKPAGARRVRATEEPAGEEADAMRDDGGAEEHAQRDAEARDEDEDDDLVARLRARRRRNRVSYMASDSSSSSSEDEEQQYDGNEGREDNDGGSDQVGDDPIEQLLRDNDSVADSVDGDAGGEGNDDGDGANALRGELGLEDDIDDQWDEIARQHPGLFIAERPPLQQLRRHGHEIAMHFAGDGAHGRANGQAHGRHAPIVDLQVAQNDDTQAIDLTELPSDDGDDADDDDDVEIVGATAPLLPMPIRPIADVRLVPGRTPNPNQNRKRRRTNTDVVAAPRPFDTQRAESTNVSLENNETIERFKAALKCSVCLEVIEDMTSTICGHVYCAKCIRLAIRVTHKCPLCQRPLRPTDIHGLYF